ncbi:MAG: helix-turn-helix transcriptional regulator [Planctomycetes bacterium]|nr:helix-turn-helix transcriptional regulator [Planctomycetota bacterium]
MQKSKPKSFSELYKEAKSSSEYWVQRAIVEFTEEMLGVMEQKEINRSNLARKLGVTSAFVTKLLRGNNNFRLETMVKIARALDTEFKIHLQPDGCDTRWFDIFNFNGKSAPERDEEIDLQKLSKKFVEATKTTQSEEIRCDSIPA